MDFLHKELINREHIGNIIKQALNDDRKLFCRHQHAGEDEEVQITCVKSTDTHLYFMVPHSAQFEIQINDLLTIHFTVRHENRFLPCEISVRAKSFRLYQGRLFFYTSYPISIRHRQRRLFARYPVTADCFSQMELAYTNSDYFYSDKWNVFEPELVNIGNISIGGIMLFLRQNDSWEKKLTYRSTLILSCTFNTEDSRTAEKNAFYIAGSILDIQQSGHCRIKQIRVKFSHWTYQHNISWKEIKVNEGIEAMAKFLFQYAYKNKLVTY